MSLKETIVALANCAVAEASMSELTIYRTEYTHIYINRKRREIKLNSNKKKIHQNVDENFKVFQEDEVRQKV